MAKILLMDPTPEQREELAGAIVERIKLGNRVGDLSEYEKEIVKELYAGRAVTVGRLHILREAEERIFGE
mgnify:CR=1